MVILESALAVAALGGVWAFGVEPRRLMVRRFSVPWPGVPGSRLRIGVLSDLHAARPHMGEGRIRRIVARLLAEDPDLVLLPGDFVATGTVGVAPLPPERIARALAPLARGRPVFAVLGNHDWDLGGEAVAAALEEVEIRVLRNEHLRLPTPFGELVLAGVDDPVTRRDDLARALAGTEPDEPVLLLAHAPDIHTAAPEQVRLLIAGHTHGGQVRLPGLPPPVTLSRLPRRQAHGLHHDRGRHLLVTAGVGTTGLPLRFARPPELVVLDLVGDGTRGAVAAAEPVADPA